MQLVGQPVKHISFGKGIITDLSSDMVTVHFSQGEKKFLYPDAFSRFLTLKDTAKQKAVNAKYSRQLQDEEEEKKKAQEEHERRKKLRTMKILPNSQAAFDIACEEADGIVEAGRVSTGCLLSGSSKGEPRIPSRLGPNSACLLTGCLRTGEEEDRRILGAFMAAEDFWGERCRDGVVKGHEEYRICLPFDAAPAYWDYFEHSDPIPRWGKVVFKYFSNSIMQDILLDMIRASAGTGQEKAAKDFYHYFCMINRLSPEAVKEGTQPAARKPKGPPGGGPFGYRAFFIRERLEPDGFWKAQLFGERKVFLNYFLRVYDAFLPGFFRLLASISPGTKISLTPSALCRRGDDAGGVVAQLTLRSSPGSHDIDAVDGPAEAGHAGVHRHLKIVSAGPKVVAPGDRDGGCAMLFDNADGQPHAAFAYDHAQHIFYRPTEKLPEESIGREQPAKSERFIIARDGGLYSGRKGGRALA